MMESRMVALIKKIRKERMLLHYSRFLEILKERKTMTFKEIITLKGIPFTRSILINLVKNGIIDRVKTSRGTRYYYTNISEKFHEMIKSEINMIIEEEKPKVLSLTNMEWVIRTILKIRDEGYDRFNKGLFFKKLYELIEELETKGYHVIKPKIVSVDRCLRSAVELGFLERRGTKQRPIYIINDGKIKEMIFYAL